MRDKRGRGETADRAGKRPLAVILGVAGERLSPDERRPSCAKQSGGTMRRF